MASEADSEQCSQKLTESGDPVVPPKVPLVLGGVIFLRFDA